MAAWRSHVEKLKILSSVFLLMLDGIGMILEI